jgi:hypothetical protein
LVEEHLCIYFGNYFLEDSQHRETVPSPYSFLFLDASKQDSTTTGETTNTAETTTTGSTTTGPTTTTAYSGPGAQVYGGFSAEVIHF